MNNEYDITKSMLRTIRNKSSEHKDIIKENEANAIDLSDQELKNEKTKFMDIVNPRVEFNAFKIYPSANNVVFSGKFDNGIEWQFSKSDGLYFNAPNMELEDETLDLLKKLSAYYVNWSDEWSKKLNTEYKGDNNVQG